MGFDNDHGLSRGEDKPDTLGALLGILGLLLLALFITGAIK